MMASDSVDKAAVATAQSLESMKQQIELSKLKTDLAERQYALLKAEFEVLQEKVAEGTAALVQSEQAAAAAEQVQATAAATMPVIKEEELREIITGIGGQAQEGATMPTPAPVAAPVAQPMMDAIAQASAGDVGTAAAEALQDVTEAGAVLDPEAAREAIKATGDAILASQPAGPDVTPVLLFSVAVTVVYQFSEMIKAVPKVSGEPASQKIPSFASLAADANKKSTAEAGQRNAWQVVTAGLASLEAGTYDGKSPIDAFYAPVSPPITAAAASAPVVAKTGVTLTSAATPVVTTVSRRPSAQGQAAPRMGAKQLAKEAARAAAADEAADADGALAGVETALKGVVTPIGGAKKRSRKAKGKRQMS